MIYDMKNEIDRINAGLYFERLHKSKDAVFSVRQLSKRAVNNKNLVTTIHLYFKYLEILTDVPDLYFKYELCKKKWFRKTFVKNFSLFGKDVKWVRSFYDLSEEEMQQVFLMFRSRVSKEFSIYLPDINETVNINIIKQEVKKYAESKKNIG